MKPSLVESDHGSDVEAFPTPEAFAIGWFFVGSDLEPKNDRERAELLADMLAYARLHYGPMGRA